MTITDADRSELNAHTIPQADPQLPPEPPAARQVGVLVEFVLDGRESEPLRVRITNRDRIAYEKAAARHKEWPTGEGGRHFAMTFHIWSAARRAGLTAATFDGFAEQVLDYDAVAEEPADPTR